MVAIDLLALPLDLHLTALLKLESRKLGQQLNVHCNALDKKGKMYSLDNIVYYT